MHLGDCYRENHDTVLVFVMGKKVQCARCSVSLVVTCGRLVYGGHGGG